MREIEFRAWADGRMWDVEITMDGYVHYWNEEEMEIQILGALTDGRVPRRVEVMQYIRIKDDNHKKIFEKDIIVSEKECPDDFFIVEWEKESAGFRMKSPKTSEIMYWPLNDPAVHFFMECKIIGNIYENPELIKV